MTVAGVVAMCAATAAVVILTVRALQKRKAAVLSEIVDRFGNVPLAANLEAVRDAVEALNESISDAARNSPSPTWSSGGSSGQSADSLPKGRAAAAPSLSPNWAPSAHPGSNVAVLDVANFKRASASAGSILRRRLRPLRRRESLLHLELLIELVANARPGDPVRAMVLERFAQLCAFGEGQEELRDCYHILLTVDRPPAASMESRNQGRATADAFMYWCQRERSTSGYFRYMDEMRMRIIDAASASSKGDVLQPLAIEAAGQS